jgi:hypothetical protein
MWEVRKTSASRELNVTWIVTGWYLQYFLQPSTTPNPNTPHATLQMTSSQSPYIGELCLKSDSFKKRSNLFSTIHYCRFNNSKFTGSRFHVCSFLFLSCDLIWFWMILYIFLKRKGKYQSHFPLYFIFKLWRLKYDIPIAMLLHRGTIFFSYFVVLYTTYFRQ